MSTLKIKSEEYKDALSEANIQKKHDTEKLKQNVYPTKRRTLLTLEDVIEHYFCRNLGMKTTTKIN